MEANTAYMTLMGRSGWAVVNSFHAVLIETQYRPHTVFILYESQLADEVKPVMRGIETLQKTYTEPNVISLEIPTWDARAAGKLAAETVRALKAKNTSVALDITGGRKALVAGALLGLKDQVIDQVYYLAIDTTVGVAKPYPMIPRAIQRLINLTTNEEQMDTSKLDPKTGSTDLVFTKEELLILLNHVYTRNENIIVHAPLIGVDLLQLDIKNRGIQILVNGADYERQTREISNGTWDQPSFSDFRDCLHFCGVLNFENENELHELLVKNFNRSHHLRTGVRKPVLALDSNMFYNGFPSYLERLEQTLQIHSERVPCVTAYPVLKEIQKSITDKYQRADIRAAKEYYNSEQMNPLLEEFLGQNVLHTRTAKMAKAELAKFMQRPIHEKTPKVSLPSSKEDVDILIVEALEEFAKTKGVRVVLVSADKNMYDHCELTEDVGVRLLKFAKEIPRKVEVPGMCFADLLVGLSILYGVLKLEKIGYLFGEYRGKGSENYTNEVKLRLHNIHRAQILGERVNICRKLMKLGITN